MDQTTLPSYSYGQGALVADLGNQYMLSITRPHDFTVLLLHLTGFQLDRDTNVFHRLEGEEACLAIWFPPQSIMEEAFYQQDEDPNEFPPPASGLTDELPTYFPVRHRMSGMSRLVFGIPEEINAIENNVSALLNWDKYDLLIDSRAESGDGIDIIQINPNLEIIGDLIRPIWSERRELSLDLASELNDLSLAENLVDIRTQQEGIPLLNIGVSTFLPVFDFGVIIDPDKFKKPGPKDTFIETPYRLMLSPNEKHRWRHKIQLDEAEDEHELWHTRLVEKKGEQFIEADRSTPLYLKAPWSKDAKLHDPQGANVPEVVSYRTALLSVDRHDIVHLTSNKIGNYTPIPFKAFQFALSPLGSYMDFYGNWDVSTRPAGITLINWVHQSTLGRDHYVRVVNVGYLFPFGHKAALVRITERKIGDNILDKGPTAASFQWEYIVVRERFKEYPDFNAQNDSLAESDSAKYRKLPLQNVFIENARTPNIDPKENSMITSHGSNVGNQAFWINVGGKSFKFKFKVRDLENREIGFEAPLIFVGETLGDNFNISDTDSETINNAYTNTAIPLSNQLMAIAPAVEKNRTSFETEDLYFESINNAHGNKPNFFPVIKEARILATPINNLMGKNDLATSVIPFYQPNKGEVFATLKYAKGLDFEQNGEKSGGIATPNINIGALSQTLGPIGDPDVTDPTNLVNSDIFDGKFNPEKFFNGAVPKIFGAISILDILGAIAQEIPSDAGAISSVAPQLIETIKDGKFETSYDWKPTLKSVDTAFFKFIPGGKPLCLQTKIVVPIENPGAGPETSIEGTLEEFIIELFEVIQLSFDKLSFKTTNGEKLDVDCQIGPGGLKFIGFLRFVNVLQTIIPSDGFSDPPFLNVSPLGIEVGYTQAIPSVSVGVFGLQNIKLGAALELPLLGGKPLTFTFNFCEREDPFNLSVYIFGGGGFFAISVNLSGLEKVEAAFEFGASLAFDIGIASGGVYLKAGFYFAMESVSGGSKITFQGYIKMGGNLSILGLISLSLTFSMSLTYESNPAPAEDVLWGEAKLEVKVEVLFFSKTVTLQVRRELKGNSDPSGMAFVMQPMAFGNPGNGPKTFSEVMDTPRWINYAKAFA